jgi:hypothetical protein
MYEKLGYAVYRQVRGKCHKKYDLVLCVHTVQQKTLKLFKDNF